MSNTFLNQLQNVVKLNQQYAIEVEQILSEGHDSFQSATIQWLFVAVEKYWQISEMALASGYFETEQSLHIDLSNFMEF
ncbi:hypothetical protein HC928_04515 [bacterium]|nr:hypothetical protein [bacterium]